ALPDTNVAPACPRVLPGPFRLTVSSTSPDSPGATSPSAQVTRLFASVPPAEAATSVAPAGSGALKTRFCAAALPPFIHANEKVASGAVTRSAPDATSTRPGGGSTVVSAFDCAACACPAAQNVPDAWSVNVPAAPS